MPTRGQQAEDAALAFLQKQGLRLLARNFRCRRGELDLVMQHGDCIVFVEVRYRRQARYGSALESIDAAKQTRLIHTAQVYLTQQRWHDRPARFDVVAFDADALQWLQNAF